jgi:chemotaxis protein methyltransferase CheR
MSEIPVALPRPHVVVAPRRPGKPLLPVAPPFTDSLPDRLFVEFQTLIKQTAGIHLHTGKKALLVGRLSARLRELGLENFADYLAAVRRSPEELAQMVDRVCTNETRFFRELQQFDHIVRLAIPAWRAGAAAGRRPRVIRVWSAACSSGEEPFSIAMLLLAALPAAEGWRHEILATDLSNKILGRARAATWKLDRAADIPDAYLKAFMLRGVGAQAGKFRAGALLREAIRFMPHNLLHAPPASGFDLIFCRNVLIYFDTATKLGVVERLRTALSPDGWLLLGHAESLLGVLEGARSVGPNIYDFPARQACRGGARG